MNTQMLMDIIRYIEDLMGDSVFLENWDSSVSLNNRDESYYAVSEITINPEIFSILPLDITDLVITYGNMYGMDVYDVIESMSTVVIPLEELGFKYRLDDIIVNLVIVEEKDRFLVTQIVV